MTRKPLHVFAALSLFGLAACGPAVTASVERPQPAPAPVSGPVQAAPPSSALGQRQDARQLALSFIAVVDQVEPVAERICRQQTTGANCDFRIVIDDRPNQPPNAFQTLDRSGRPVIGFTLALIDSTNNRDELAFVLGHEAAHHIAGHLARQRSAANLGAAVFGRLASSQGAGSQGVRAAQQLGSQVGARTFSRDFELEADALGTRITAAAGYNPLRGAEFFARIPDPGNRFLGTHPPNAQRVATVQREVQAIRAGR